MRTRHLTAAGTAALLACTVAATSAAVAADYPVLRGSQIEDVPPAPREFDSGPGNWGGIYYGISAGYATGQFDPFKQSENLSQQAFDQLLVRDSGVNLIRFGKTSSDKAGFGGFIGYNYQFGDAVLGVEAEYFKADFTTDQRASTSRLTTGLFPTTIMSAPNVEPVNTQTTINVTGHTTSKLEDFGMVKARAGYAFGNFMPFLNIGAAIGRISTNGAISQNHSTVENFARFNTITDSTGAVTRTTFIGNAAIARPDAAGRTTAAVVSSGYVPGLALGVGLDALLGDHILLRAEYNRIYFSAYKGVNVIVDTARVGAGLKF